MSTDFSAVCFTCRKTFHLGQRMARFYSFGHGSMDSAGAALAARLVHAHLGHDLRIMGDPPEDGGEWRHVELDPSAVRADEREAFDVNLANAKFDADRRARIEEQTLTIKRWMRDADGVPLDVEEALERLAADLGVRWERDEDYLLDYKNE